MTDLAQAANDAIRSASPALYDLLSPLGRRVAFPPDIPFQAAEARGRELNGTIGQITDGRGGAVALPSLVSALDGLPPERRNRALLYSPVEGLPELRAAWRAWQRRGQSAARPSSLPLVTVGLTHGLALAADLFGGEGRAVAVPSPFWGNYRQTFATRTGARMLSSPAYRNGRFDPLFAVRALADEPDGEPAVAILNLPSNPGGYSPTPEERGEIRAGLVRIAERRPLVVLCDDAYAGLVFEPDIPRHSMFWDLLDAHPSLLPVKIDGATKELSFFGGRVGFLTFPFEPESAAARALESKVKCLVRAGLGSPVATSQVVVLAALESGRAEAEVEEARQLLEARYRVLREALDGVDRDLLQPRPFNSGCFALIELGPAVVASADALRRHLLERHDTGLTSIGERHVRIAFCSVEQRALPELVRRLEVGASEVGSS